METRSSHSDLRCPSLTPFTDLCRYFIYLHWQASHSLYRAMSPENYTESAVHCWLSSHNELYPLQAKFFERQKIQRSLDKLKKRVQKSGLTISSEEQQQMKQLEEDLQVRYSFWVTLIQFAFKPFMSHITKPQVLVTLYYEVLRFSLTPCFGGGLVWSLNSSAMTDILLATDALASSTGLEKFKSCLSSVTRTSALMRRRMIA